MKLHPRAGFALPDKRDCPLHLALGLSTVGAAQYRLEPVESGEILKLPVQGAVLLL